MTAKLRGADILARTLDEAGLRKIFTLSGNHIMPVFDAALGTGLQLVHTRHEAAAVHMADAYARLTGECGIALVTGGAGHTNATAALCTAEAAEAPLVLLSGHAGIKELGRGAFQETRQADMAEPVSKASWTAGSAATLAHDIAKAVRIAKSGRPGPVHLSLPFDVLEDAIDPASALAVTGQDFAASAPLLADAAADRILTALAGAARPLVLTGPTLCHAGRREIVGRLAKATGVPVLPMESPRGINDPRLGAFAEVLARADLIVLLGKPSDFSIRFGDAPAVDAAARFIVVDPDQRLIDRVAREKGKRLIATALAGAATAAETLIQRAARTQGRKSGGSKSEAWAQEVAEAVAYRPAAWRETRSTTQGLVHPIELCMGVKSRIESNSRAVLICDGGEIGQWPQALIEAHRRVINGVSGSIGASLPFAVAARTVEAKAPVIAIMGDGTFGFQMAELDTAVRNNLPFVAVIGNDAAWNAEHQIQLRSYGKDRTHSCELLPTRYDLVATALGGHGELVTSADAIGPAIDRAIASGKPSVVNVMMERHAAPVVRRAG